MASKEQFPRQIWNIIGNEACERFSFYGMRSILMIYLVDYLMRDLPPSTREPVAKANFHLFVMGVYFFPVIGGFVADRFWGKYQTIFWMSLLYCVGNALLAVFDQNLTGFYLGLLLIALGSGGIKPCVSAFVGDQFSEANKHLTKKVFAAFYWSINLGSFFASLLIPKTLKIWGPKVAFGIPGVLMFVATVIFWLGKSRYAELPPTGPNPHSFWRVIWSAFTNPRQPKNAASTPIVGRFLDRALVNHPTEAVIGARAVLRILSVFAPIPFFWMLFDQKASAWVVQAKQMDRQIGPWVFEPSQLQFINPALVMILIPVTTSIIYPALNRAGFPLRPLKRMTIGMFFAAVSFVLVAGIQGVLDSGKPLSVLWQIAPYVALTIAEILISTTGLEFAYSQAPVDMKSTIMAFWYLAVAAGNLIVAIISRLNVFHGSASFLFYAGLVFLAGIALGIISKTYVPMDFFRREESAPTDLKARQGDSAYGQPVPVAKA